MIYHQMVSMMKAELSNVMETNKLLSNCVDFTFPHEWYPHARLMKRKIYYHGGPTNSGKTYYAIQRLKEASAKHGGGLYCGPLRLLALEIYDTLNRLGVPTNLITGQEKRILPVIDEIQMICDRHRSHAWTRVLLGLRAREIHLCGGLEAAEVESESLRGDYSKVRPGDCIVAFSVAEIFAIRKQIETLTKLKCAVIYGQLPSETRSTQARLFNDDNSGYDVLVASDAIGMGLNLNIGRIIFHNTFKFAGPGIVEHIEPFHIKQIAGRAGRKSSKFSVGKVTTWQEPDLAYVKAVMEWDIPPINATGIFPSAPQLHEFITRLQQHQADRPATSSDKENGSHIASTVPTTLSQPVTDIQLSAVIERFIGLSQTDPRYFICDTKSFSTITNWLHPIPMSLEDKFTFACAPANFKNSMTMTNLYQYAALYACGRPVPLNVRLNKALPRDLLSFRRLCDQHNTLELYLWLSNHFPTNFIERETCIYMKNYATNLIEKSLPAHSFRNDIDLVDSSYRRLAKKIRGERLPPLRYGLELRERTAQYLAQIPVNLRYVAAPGLAEEEENDAKKEKVRSGFKPILNHRAREIDDDRNSIPAEEMIDQILNAP
eukprot:scaffold9105_cov169-Ochromonas_danica.AAC.5